ncbi:MAG: hypothetical protein ABFD69_00430 [Candidatus Sumerlaeia bacterium]
MDRGKSPDILFSANNSAPGASYIVMGGKQKAMARAMKTFKALHHHRAGKAFTLIELLIIVMTITVAGVIIIPILL